MRITGPMAQIFEDEVEASARVTTDGLLPPERAPLADITNSAQNETLDLLMLDDELEKPKINTPRLLNIGDKTGRVDDEPMDVLEDDDQSEASSAAEEACRELLRPVTSPEVYRLQVRHPDKVKSPASKAVKRARKNLSPKSHTPRFDPNVHKSPRVVRSPTRAQRKSEKKRDSFLDDITSRSPAKLGRTAQKIASERAKEKGKAQPPPRRKASGMESPFSSLSTVPTLRKRRSRIEDSLDALDAMEDMLDEVKESLACVDRPRTASSSHADFPRHLVIRQMEDRLPRSAPQTPRGRSIQTLLKAQTPERVPLRIASDNLNVPRRTASTRSLSSAKTNISGNISHTGSDVSAKSGRPAAKSVDLSNAPKPTLPPVLKSKPSAPVKSSKPPTASTFVLPGEIVSARIRAQREARQARTTGSISSDIAKPPPAVTKTAAAEKEGKRISSCPDVRMTAASLARLRIARGEKPAPTQHKKQASTSTVTAAPEPGRPRAPATCVTAPTLSTAARSAATRTTAASAARAAPPCSTTLGNNKPVTTPLQVSKTATKTEAGAQARRSTRPVSGVYGVKAESSLKRTPSTRSMTGQPTSKKLATETAKVSLADRAEAAKRAREEAAERGRQASKQWAEKVRKRNSGVFSEKAGDA